MSPIVDQGALGSCTANAIASGLGEHLQVVGGGELVPLSRLYLYWHERYLEGTLTEDAGAFIRDGMKTFKEIGIAPEADFPYDIAKFTQTPSAQAEKDAADHKITEYHRVLTYATLKSALAAGHPVVIGTDVYTSFEGNDAAVSGILPDVDKSKEQLLGGHAVLAVGYKIGLDFEGKNPQEYIIIRNSWGVEWGDGGYCYMPKSYWDHGLVSDMWVGTNAVTPTPTPVSLTFEQAVDLCSKTTPPIMTSPEFWLALGKKYASVSKSDFRYLQALIVNMGNYLTHANK
jgi:C1A family cysteine protease